MEPVVKQNRKRSKREFVILVAVLWIVTLACGTSSNPSPPSNRPQEPRPPATSPPKPPRDITSDDLASHGQGPSNPGGQTGCTGSQPSIAVCSYGGNSLSTVVTLTGSRSKVALGEWVVVSGCNFQQGEPLAVELELADGKTQKSSVNPSGQSWKTAWWITPEKPLGEYSVNVRTGSDSYSKTFSVIAPSRPVVTSGFDKGESEATVILAGFQPGEEVLLGRYIPEAGGPTVLSDHRFVTVDADGTLVDQFPLKDAVFVAIGQDKPESYGIDPGPMPVSAFDYLAWLGSSAAPSDRYICKQGGSFQGPALPTAAGGGEVQQSP